jgi:hypothetical protein
MFPSSYCYIHPHHPHLSLPDLISATMAAVNPQQREVYAAWWFAVALPALTAAYAAHHTTHPPLPSTDNNPSNTHPHNHSDNNNDNGNGNNTAFSVPNAPGPPRHPHCFIQHEGDTVYIPAGWYHAVLNLDTTVCVTQNFAERCNYPQVCTAIYQEEAIAQEEKDAWRSRALDSFKDMPM